MEHYDLPRIIAIAAMIVAIIAMIFARVELLKALRVIESMDSSRASRLASERLYSSYLANLENLNSSPYDCLGNSDFKNTSASGNSETDLRKSSSLDVSGIVNETPNV